MKGPDLARIKRTEGYHSLVDGIPFVMPINCTNSPVLTAMFSVDLEKARELMPCKELHPFQLWKRGVLVITVINYLETDIGKYVEFSIGIACTHGRKPAPRFLPAIFQNSFGLGQYVFDLPVSSEISVKGGKGIWGMPKHQANLNYTITEKTVSSQYDLDGQLAVKIEIERPQKTWLPMKTSAANYSAFRGMLMKSYVHFGGKAGVTISKPGAAVLTIGSHPRVQALKGLDIDPKAITTAFIPQANGALDDYMESWFLTYDQPVTVMPEGMEVTLPLGHSQQWLAPPTEHPECEQSSHM